ncbi:hypothetical protein GGR56DRAFT_93493 [Xylariaceae sp. FL0804]|nr:hypothetical protein GGR56DRAFT_93493 [Xylariaceae sp. FL0804]
MHVALGIRLGSKTARTPPTSCTIPSAGCYGTWLKCKAKQVDRFRPGYPRFTALLSSHSAFQNIRRFKRTRLRLLLVKQYETSVLEQELDELDRTEDRDLVLGCIQRDVNTKRHDAIQRLNKTLTEYDDMVERTRRMLSLPDPQPGEIQDVKDWVEATGYISRDEMAYLDVQGDLANLTSPRDSVMAFAEWMVEGGMFWLERLLGRCFPALGRMIYRISSDKHVLLLGPLLRALSRAIATCIITLLILTPTFILPKLSNIAGRTVASVFSAAAFLFAIAFFTGARSVEIFAAGARRVTPL